MQLEGIHHITAITGDAPANESLQLPECYEPMREKLERTLTPLRNPRASAPAS